MNAQFPTLFDYVLDNYLDSPQGPGQKAKSVDLDKLREFATKLLTDVQPSSIQHAVSGYNVQLTNGDTVSVCYPSPLVANLNSPYVVVTGVQPGSPGGNPLAGTMEPSSYIPVTMDPQEFR